ncbi:hypothetical protein [Yinghuangia aomiensis]|uniref:hypothetical protein n=1 Tax=Yinghuangia aomiensis TaxID=676205 RepID=UPI0031EE775A
MAHNVTAATRLLDLLRVVGGDRRIGTSLPAPGGITYADSTRPPTPTAARPSPP